MIRITMITTIKIIFLLTISLLMASCNKDKYVQMMIEKDCTGTYLRGKYFSLNDEDFMVCNESVLDSYKNGEIINVEFEIVKECSPPYYHVCMMVHQHKVSNMVEIKKIE